VTKGTAQFQLSGFPAANREAEVELVNKATGQSIRRNPFLDGSLVVRDIDPGLWDVKVTHPNLVTTPVFTGKIRVFPQPLPTFVPIPVPPVLFKDTPIRDIPDANLGPVQQAVTAARDALGTIGGKAPGEVIRAADWNTLVGSVRDIADNVLQLAGLVSPIGHDHPEIAEKIAEVQDNMRRFAEAYGRSLLEFRRELEAEFLRQRLSNALDELGAPQATRDELLGRVRQLNASLQAETTVFTAQLANTGSRVLTTVAELTTAKPELRATANTQVLQQVAQQYVASGTLTNADAELKLYNRTGSAAGGKMTTASRTGR
jgi:hypothetical protein